MELTEIKVEIPASMTDAANDLLLELGVAGWSLLEDVIVKRAWVIGIFESAEEAKTRWDELQGILIGSGVVVTGLAEERPLGDREWKDSYKAHFHAWQFGRLHWVPVWERATFVLPPQDAVLWLDPGLAFGTGNHETTRLCVERLVTLAARKGVSGTVIDAGCGSGILALSAVLLGHRDVVGFDNDAEAIRVSVENAALNGLAERIDFFTADLVSGLAGRDADIVVANIQADVLMRFAEGFIGAVRAGGTLILSGILAVENEVVRNCFSGAAPSWSVETKVMGEWSDVVLTKPA